MKYFLKEIVQTPVIGPDGKPVEWERLAQSYGVIAVEDDTPTATWLEECAQKRILGVRKISAEEYEDYKKKLPYSPSESQSQATLKIMEPPQIIPPRPKTPLSQEEDQPLPQPRDPFREHVQSAMAKVSAQVAAGYANATSAKAGESSGADSTPKPNVMEEAVKVAKRSVGRPRIKPVDAQ